MITCDVEDLDMNSLWRDAVGNQIVVVINGVGGSGKDTFVYYIDKHLRKIENPSPFSKKRRVLVEDTSIVKNISTIDCVKFAAARLGWEHNNKDDKSRKFLSDLKKLAVEYSDIPYQSCRETVYKGMQKVCFIHCREPEEIKRFVDEFGAITVLVRRSDIPIPNNSSDSGVEEYKYDYYIENNGDIFMLEKLAIDFAKEIGLEEWLIK